jgi:hypothetical protein
MQVTASFGHRHGIFVIVVSINPQQTDGGCLFFMTVIRRTKTKEL